MNTEATLSAEFDAWLAARPWYTPMSADELQAEIIGNWLDWPKDANDDARADVQWLGDFINRWEAMMQKAGY